MKAQFPITLLFMMTLSTAVLAGVREEQRSWDKLTSFAESILGEGGILDPNTSDSRIDTLIDLHVAFSREFLDKPIAAERITLVKTSLRLFLLRIPDRYKGESRASALRLVKDLVANRALFVQLLTSQDGADALEQQLWAYLERNQSLSYKEPVSIASQVTAPQSDTPLVIVGDSVRLVADVGTHGHYNSAVDAGETISINIPLKNVANEAYRSTSGFLTTRDRFVRSDSSEVVYCEKTVSDGQTISFGPGTSVTPRQHFTFTVSPDCPDKHEVHFALLIIDSDRKGQDFSIPFSVTIYNVGPLDFGESRIDDDMPGPSDGNDNGVIEPGETIEYVLAIQNRGAVPIENIEATLLFREPLIHFKPNDDMLLYRSVDPRQERPISSSFIFRVDEGPHDDVTGLHMRLLVRGQSRNHSYSWLQSRVLPLGVTDEYWDNLLKKIDAMIAGGNPQQVLDTFHNPRLSYRVLTSRPAQDAIVQCRNLIENKNADDEKRTEADRRRKQMLAMGGRASFAAPDKVTENSAFSTVERVGECAIMRKDGSTLKCRVFLRLKYRMVRETWGVNQTKPDSLGRLYTGFYRVSDDSELIGWVEVEGAGRSPVVHGPPLSETEINWRGLRIVARKRFTTNPDNNKEASIRVEQRDYFR